MFGKLRFIIIFDTFLRYQRDLSAHYFCHFSTSSVLRHIDFPMEISVLKCQACQFDEKLTF